MLYSHKLFTIKKLDLTLEDRWEGISHRRHSLNHAEVPITKCNISGARERHVLRADLFAKTDNVASSRHYTPASGYVDFAASLRKTGMHLRPSKTEPILLTDRPSTLLRASLITRRKIALTTRKTFSGKLPALMKNSCVE